jgi:hypothetical protein
MEQFETLETDKKEQPRPSLGEEMSKLLASMDPQGLLNEADQEDSQTHTGVDPSKTGDAHAAAHEVSLTDSGSESGSGSGTEQDDSGREPEKMDTNPPNFRIVDIESRPDLQPIQTTQYAADAAADAGAGVQRGTEMPAAASTPVPDQHSDTEMATTEEDGKGRTAAPVFAVPAIPPNIAGGSNDKQAPLVAGKNIFQKQSNNPNFNQSNIFEKTMRNLKHAETDQNFRKVPTGVQAPKPSDSLPPKKFAPVEPDAVPSKTYDAILLNKKNRRKRAPLVASLPARLLPNAVIFSIKVITGCSARFTRRMSTLCLSRQ